MMTRDRLTTIRQEYDSYAAKEATTTTELFRLVSRIPELLTALAQEMAQGKLPLEAA